MAATPDNALLQRSAATSGPEATADQSSAGSKQVLPSELEQSFNQLRERFERTTNALASAAHDLKTPLAILNGYVELLQSEKLGPLNERQRDVLDDMATKLTSNKSINNPMTR